MPFELFKGRGQRGRYGFPVITVQSSGGIGINDVAYELLENPEAVLLHFDRRAKRIGLKGARSDDQLAYPIRSSGGSSYILSVRTFLKFYDIDFSATKRYRAVQDDNLLVADLDEPISIRQRRGKAGTEGGERDENDRGTD